MIHKELLGQTEFLREVLKSAKNQCCGKIEIFCPCSKEELTKIVHFLYHGEINCEDVFESFGIQEDLNKIFGFPENLNLNDQIASLLNDPMLSSILDRGKYLYRKSNLFAMRSKSSHIVPFFHKK